jgi:hypothetical protein
MYKYRAQASFFIWKEVCTCAMNKTREMLLTRGAATRMLGFEEFWEDFHRYVFATHATGRSEQEVLEPTEVEFYHDIERWLEDGCSSNLDTYRFEEPKEVQFQLTEEGHSEIAAALDVWSPELSGLTKLVTRIRISSQVRVANMMDAH